VQFTAPITLRTDILYKLQYHKRSTPTPNTVQQHNTELHKSLYTEINYFTEWYSDA